MIPRASQLFIQKCQCRCPFVPYRFYCNTAFEVSPQKENGRNTSKSVRTQQHEINNLKSLDEFKKKLRVEKFTQIQVLPKVRGAPSVPSLGKEMGDGKLTSNMRKNVIKEEIYKGNTTITQNFKIKLQHLISLKQYSEVLREFEHFLQKHPEHLNRNIYKLVLHAHILLENLPQTEKYFQNVKKIKEIDTTMYNMMIKILTQNGKTEEARELLEEMKANKEILPGVDTYTIFLTHYGFNGKVKEMKEILFEMRALEIELDTRMFCSLLNGLMRNGKEDEGILLFETMKSQKIKPTTQCYNIAMSMYLKSGNIQKIFQLFEEMKKYYLMPDNDTCFIIMQSYEKEKNIPAALVLFEEMKNFLEVNPSLSCIAIRMYHYQKDFTKALELWTEFENSGKIGNSYLYAEVMKLYHTINSLPKAMELFSSLFNTEYVNIYLCNPLLSLYILNEKYEEAFEMMKEIKKRELIPNHQTFPLFFKVYAQANMVVEAKECFEQMKSLGIGMYYTKYKDLAAMFKKHGQDENADMVMKEASNYLQRKTQNKSPMGDQKK